MILSYTKKCRIPSSINSLKIGVRNNKTQCLELIFSFKEHITYDYTCIHCTNFDFIMQRSFMNPMGIFGTAVFLTVAILCFHLLYSSFIWVKHTFQIKKSIGDWLFRPPATPVSHVSVWRKEFFNDQSNRSFIVVSTEAFDTQLWTANRHKDFV